MIKKKVFIWSDPSLNFAFRINAKFKERYFEIHEWLNIVLVNLYKDAAILVMEMRVRGNSVIWNESTDKCVDEEGCLCRRLLTDLTHQNHCQMYFEVIYWKQAFHNWLKVTCANPNPLIYQEASLGPRYPSHNVIRYPYGLGIHYMVDIKFKEMTDTQN